MFTQAVPDYLIVLTVYHNFNKILLCLMTHYGNTNSFINILLSKQKDIFMYEVTNTLIKIFMLQHMYYYVFLDPNWSFVDQPWQSFVDQPWQSIQTEFMPWMWEMVFICRCSEDPSADSHGPQTLRLSTLWPRLFSQWWAQSTCAENPWRHKTIPM